MPNFEELFLKSKGKPVEYNGKEVRMMDEFPAKDGDALILSMEKFNSEWKQGIHLETKGFFLVNNQKIKNTIVLWQDSAPKTVEFELSLKKQGSIIVKNVWDTGDGVMHSWHHGSGIIIEDIPDGKRYFCNDGHPDDNFDDIVFTLSKK